METYKVAHFWTCCQCGYGPLNIHIFNHCIQATCFHHRCANCCWDGHGVRVVDFESVQVQTKPEFKQEKASKKATIQFDYASDTDGQGSEPTSKAREAGDRSRRLAALAPESEDSLLGTIADRIFDEWLRTHRSGTPRDTTSSPTSSQSGVQALAGGGSRDGERAPGNHGTWQSSQDPGGSVRQSPRKRNRPETGTGADQAGAATDGGEGIRLKQAKTSSTQDVSKSYRLACPFYKKDQQKYKDCFRHRLSKISFVKQHLYRQHRQPHHCFRCGQVFGPDDAALSALQAHQQEASGCELRPGFPVPDGITIRQREQLSCRGGLSADEAERWYHIWDIIFPGVERPHSPYLDDELSEDLCSFREFQLAHGAEIVWATITERNDGEPRDAISMQAVLNLGLDRVYRRWQERSRTGMPTLPSASPVCTAEERTPAEGNQESPPDEERSTSNPQPPYNPPAAGGEAEPQRSDHSQGHSARPADSEMPLPPRLARTLPDEESLHRGFNATAAGAGGLEGFGGETVMAAEGTHMGAQNGVAPDDGGFSFDFALPNFWEPFTTPQFSDVPWSVPGL